MSRNDRLFMILLYTMKVSINHPKTCEDSVYAPEEWQKESYRYSVMKNNLNMMYYPSMETHLHTGAWMCHRIRSKPFKSFSAACKFVEKHMESR